MVQLINRRNFIASLLGVSILQGGCSKKSDKDRPIGEVQNGFKNPITQKEFLNILDQVIDDSKDNPNQKYLIAFRNLLISAHKRGEDIFMDNENASAFYGVAPGNKPGESIAMIKVNRKFAQEIRNNLSKPGIKDLLIFVLIKEGVYAYDHTNNSHVELQMLEREENYWRLIDKQNRGEIKITDSNLQNATKIWIASQVHHEFYGYEIALNFLRESSDFNNLNPDQFKEYTTLHDHIISKKQYLAKFDTNGKIKEREFKEILLAHLIKIDKNTGNALSVFVDGEVEAGRWKMLLDPKTNRLISAPVIKNPYDFLIDPTFFKFVPPK